MRGLFFVLLLSAVCVSASAQHADNHQHTHEWRFPEGVGDPPAVTTKHTAVAPRIGLALQKSALLEIGASLDRYQIGYTPASDYKSFVYSNLRPYLAGEIAFGGGKNRKITGSDRKIAGGKLGVEYILASPIFGMAAGIDASYLTDGQRVATLITPRVMVSFVHFEVFYGYSFFARNRLAHLIGHHRFGISTTLNPRFWRQKRSMSEAYYSSYLE